MSEKAKSFYEFEGFRLDAENPSLWRDGKLVSLPPKALETLILLVTKKGEIVSREELLDAVWAETFVEESNINYTVSLIRKTLGGKDLIQTVPRRGYRFTADVRMSSEIGNAATSKALFDVAPQQLPSTAQPLRFRWVFVTTLAVCVIFLTSFAYFWREQAAKPAAEVKTTQNSEAMQAYTRGRMILETKNAENRQERAIDEFQNAITLDPTFALAYVGLGDAFSAYAVRASYPNNLNYYAKARSAAEKAVALNENLAEGWSLRGWLKRNIDWDFAGAESDLRRSIEIDPKIAMSHYRLAFLLLSIGRLDEALNEINTANELDPISDFIQAGRFPILEARGDYDKALEIAQTFLRENKENSHAKRAVATFLFHKKEFDRVIELAETTPEKSDNAFARFSLAAGAYAQTNQPEKAAEALLKLQTLAEGNTKALYSLAMNYAELGRIDDAIASLEKCFELREERMVWLAVEPRFANLKTDPRFTDLIRRMNLKGQL